MARQPSLEVLWSAALFHPRAAGRFAPSKSSADEALNAQNQQPPASNRQDSPKCWSILGLIFPIATSLTACLSSVSQCSLVRCRFHFRLVCFLISSANCSDCFCNSAF